ncbi:amidase [Pseudomonas matsuisoli]|uniref:Amidase n=1 Tax=Pseudomonas matsuisoli TaxID=1515666 RepID=A0A917PHP5_9PSED|nr:amidase [Pseudomonas matsuisoli]GGJ78901.1 amidase [Pseudomonas matsuisoli]
MHDLAALDATEVLELFRQRSLSPLEYLEAIEAQVACWEPHINALYGYTPEAMRAEAAASTERWAKGQPMGALDGIPVTVKELIATPGLPVPSGTLANPLIDATVDAPAAARMRESGALIFAKTTCPDFGMLSSGVSSFHGTTRNPWHPACNPGGSSSGAGAAAAAGFSPLHVGTDIGGSIRLPAAWCGIVGFKPTLGRIPINPYYVGRCAGPMTRSVTDAALMMAELAKTDRRDATRLPPSNIDWLNLPTSVKGLRIGLMMSAGCGMPLDDEIRAAVERAAKCFEAQGATIVEIEPVLTREMLDGLDQFWQARQWSQMLRLSPEQRERTLPYVLEWARGGAEIDGVTVVRGFEQTLAMRAVTEAVFDRVDAVLSPTTPIVAFPAEAHSPLGDPRKNFEHIAYTVPWNMGEQPGLSINAGWSHDGMPIGLQIVGPRFNDLEVLGLGRAFELFGEVERRMPVLRAKEGQAA